MLDKYNRDINYLRVSITDRCNLRCAYCRPKEGVSLKGHEDILRYEEILRLVSQAVKMGLVKVRLTGGEPLVRRGFVQFAAALKKIEGLQDISLTTNGVYLDRYAQAIYDAGISRINISLDSLDKDKYFDITGGGNLDDVLRGIAAAEKAGFAPIKINTVAIKGFTDDEVLDFGHPETFLPMRRMFDIISREFSLELSNEHKHRLDGPARIFKIRGGRGEIGFINPVSEHFCATCNRLRLTADGKLRACLLKDVEIDLRDALRRQCGDEELARLIRLAILSKPAGHDLDCTDRSLKKCHRDMSGIGG
jgi:cyclic pyranopterin phosphate synthase